MPSFKIKISTLFMILYCFAMFVPGYFSNVGIKILSNLMMVIAALFLLRRKYKPNKFIVLTGIYMLYLITITYINRTNAADIFSIIFFPDGLYNTSLVWNEWSTSHVAEWIYGNKNNRIYWYIMLLVTAWERYILNGKSKIWPTLIAIGTIVTMMLVKSSTATTVAIVVGTGILVSIYKKKRNTVQY